MPQPKRKPSNGTSVTPKRNTQPSVLPSPPKRNSKGQWLPGEQGSPGQPGTDAARARRQLNLMTINAMTEAFKRGGTKAIDKVMVNAPAQFLKMLVLLVPRELEVTHSGGVKGMSDEQLERGIEALELLLAKRAAGPGADAKVIEGTVADTPSATND